jgi:hypothetical protein
VPVLIYGFVEPGARLGRTTGVDGHEVRRVEADGVAALVSDLDGDAVEARRRSVRAFVDVLAAALERSTVVPMQFGAVLGSDRGVREELLEPLQEQLRSLLDEYENLVEMRLTARYDDQRLLAQIVVDNPDVRRLRGSKTQQLALGELVAGAYERRRAEDLEPLLTDLRPLSEDEAHDDVPEWGVAASSFLVRRARLGAFERAVERWAEANARLISCELAGPMAPFSFVELELPAAEASWA